MDSKRPGNINRRWEVRVLVALPAVWMLFAALESYLAIQMTRSAVGGTPVSGLRSVEDVTLVVVGVGSLAALACGVTLAVAVTRPMRDLAVKIQYRLRGDAARGSTAASEIEQLSNALDDMLLSFDKFVSNSQIVEAMPLGILVIDASDTIIRANAEARRLLPDHPLEGSPVRVLAEPAGAADLTSTLRRVRDEGVPVGIPAGILFAQPADGGEPQEAITLHPTTVVGEVVIAIRDAAQIETIRGRIQRVDRLAALGAHVASLAHELRGGLMGIQVLADALQPSAPEDAKLHDKLQQEIDRSVRLLTEIRTFGQASARERVACDLGRLVEDTIWVVGARFSDKHITVNRQVSVELPSLLLDRDRTTQAIMNVVTNAFEAAPAGGTVTAVVERVGKATLVKIANTGSFIPPEEREKIFTLFYTKKTRGSGFGLSMARRTLLDHGGEIDVTSSPDRGTEFVLRFPDQLVVPPPLVSVPARPSMSEGLAT